MKRIIAVCLLFMGLCGCFNKEETVDTSNGPIVSQDSLTDQEKVLMMVQSCVSDYNEGKIEEREEYFQTKLPPLPIEVTSLPEISSLNDLTEINEPEKYQNAFYVGEYKINDKYSARFIIYKPTKDSFWLNGKLEFLVDPDQVIQNNEEFASTRASIEPLINNADHILNILYGVDVSRSENEVEPGYSQYIPENDGLATIEGIKATAESIYTTEFLETTYYDSSFNGPTPIYKMVGGTLCVSTNDLPEAPIQKTYDLSRIVAVKEDDAALYVDILVEMYGQLQPNVYQIKFVKTDNGLRLPESI